MHFSFRVLLINKTSSSVAAADVGVGHPGTDSSKFTSDDLRRWSTGFYAYLQEHLEEANKSIGGCECGACGAPRIVAFTGKRQFVELLNADLKALGLKKKVSKIDLGRQELVPKRWPFPKETQVWVLTSTSGASALTNEARILPYSQLSKELERFSWPMKPEDIITCNKIR